jgi:hypothetical protein
VRGAYVLNDRLLWNDKSRLSPLTAKPCMCPYHRFSLAILKLTVSRHVLIDFREAYLFVRGAYVLNDRLLWNDKSRLDLDLLETVSPDVANWDNYDVLMGQSTDGEAMYVPISSLFPCNLKTSMRPQRRQDSRPGRT